MLARWLVGGVVIGFVGTQTSSVLSPKRGEL